MECGHCKRYRPTGPHRAGVDVDVSPPTGGPVGHPPNPATLCDRSAQGSKSWHSGSFAKAKYSDLSQFPSRCAVSVCRTGPPDYQLWFMTCTREEEDRITYRHVPQDRLWMESSPHSLRPCGPVPFAVTCGVCRTALITVSYVQFAKACCDFLAVWPHKNETEPEFFVGRFGFRNQEYGIVPVIVVCVWSLYAVPTCNRSRC